MKVIDFEKKEFEAFLRKSEINERFKNILILGIAHGGLPIANMAAEVLSNDFGLAIRQGTILCQRPSTKIKKSSHLREKFIKLIFSILPRSVLDKLRVAEHKKLCRRSSKDTERTILFEKEINLSGIDAILIVDDAVDSGASLKAVIDKISEIIQNKEITIITLAAALTQANPIVAPYLVLYKNVLVRFPWSLDAKNSYF